MRISIGDVRLYFDVEGSGLVPDDFRHTLAAEFDPWPSLGRVVCPTLIVNGEDDPVATAPAARRLAAALPNTEPELHVLPGTGHGVFREDPDRAIGLLRDFVPRATGRG